MPMIRPYEFTTSCGTPIHGWYTLPDKPFMVLHLLHGMMEHSNRYRELAGWLAEDGIAVYATDHPGHGLSLKEEDDLGHLDDRQGWEDVMEKVTLEQQQIRRDHPTLPMVLMGHSFGSVVARSFLQGQAEEFPFAGLILSGAMQQPVLMLRLGMAVTTLLKARYGQRYRSKLMIKLGYGQYAKFFAPNRSRFDWLSSDHNVVEDYDNDPLCGYACTTGYYRNFFRALQKTWLSHNIRKTPSDLPVLLLGGSLDPAINFGKDTHLLSEKYRENGLLNVDVRLFKSGRHEMHNEVNRMEVWSFMKEWMKGKCIQ